MVRIHHIGDLLMTFNYIDKDINWRLLNLPEETMIAYLAGIIDGEGSIGIEHLKPTYNRTKDYYVCRLTVINTNEDIMKLLVQYFKGNYDKRKDIPGRKPCFRWHVFGDNLQWALAQLEPYILIKSKQLNVVMKYRDTVGKTGWNVSDEVLQERRNLWLECKELNK